MRNSPKRPRSVTWLTVFVLIFTGGQWLRFIAALTQWDLLRELPLNVPPLYIVLSGLLWGLAGLPLTVGLFRGARWAPAAARWGSPFFAAFVWIDREVLQVSELAATNRSFALGTTIVLLVFVFWALSRPGAQAFFGERDE